jgi:asparagine synthase (glutamine-hydrolysing)
MCGWTGFWLTDRMNSEDMGHIVASMRDTLEHRGPDDCGSFVDAAAGIALGFRRLSIVDLSPLGHQPMESASGRYVMAFNGEVYNFGDIRAELEPLGYTFRGHSDTEVMLAAIEQWGLESAVSRFIGMFAIALWDRKERALSLVRDRLGIKPIFYGISNGVLLFGSELKALCQFPGFSSPVDRSAVTLYLRHAYIPAPYTIYQSVSKLPPGSILRITSPSVPLPAPKAYWSIHDAVQKGVANQFKGSDADVADELDALLRDAIRLRMIADVPLGAFLSGGIDSATIVALMQAQSTKPVKTFSIGFNEEAYNEAQHAKVIAAHLHTDHTELYATTKEAQDVIPKLPFLYDEPFADASQIPTYLVCALARREVTVSLSGDGGDELFGGYRRYFTRHFSYETVWQKSRRVPRSVRRAIAVASRATGVPSPPPLGSSKFAAAQGFARRAGAALDAGSPERFYLSLATVHHDPARTVVGGADGAYAFTREADWVDLPSLTERMMYLDGAVYLPDDILTKVDRASMGVSLEARVPILDHRVAEFAWRLPLERKIADGKGKVPLRNVLYRYVPQEMMERPKQGFRVPVESWLRTDLRDWAETLMAEDRIKREGFLNPARIRTAWKRHLDGTENNQDFLWEVLMFQAWLERWKGSVG